MTSPREESCLEESVEKPPPCLHSDVLLSFYLCLSPTSFSPPIFFFLSLSLSLFFISSSLFFCHTPSLSLLHCTKRAALSKDRSVFSSQKHTHTRLQTSLQVDCSKEEKEFSGTDYGWRKRHMVFAFDRDFTVRIREDRCS